MILSNLMSRRAAPIVLGGAVTRAARAVLRWQRRTRERDALAEATDRDLRDMGLTRAEAAAIARTPFWRA